MTSFEEILRRRRQRQPMDETLPDGTPAMEVGMRTRIGGMVDRMRGIPSVANWDVNAGEGQALLTPRNRDAITRARTVTPPIEAPTAERERAVTFNPETGRPNEDYYRERDDPRGLYNAYQNWRPHGGKRGFKSSLKAGALMAAAAAQGTDNPVAILSAFGAGAAGAAFKPDLKNKLVRGFKLQQLGSELGDELKLQKDQAAIDAAQMVPVTLDNGQTVMVPAKTAGTLQSRQQEIDLRGNTLEARKKRWNQLGEHEAARDAQALYNSGAADDSAELRAEIARRLRLPAGIDLPPRGLGNQIKIDDAGNYVVISPRSGGVIETGRKSFPATQEQNRDTRQRRALEAAKERVQMQQAGATTRAGMRGTGVRVDSATKREISRGVGSVEAIKTELTTLDEEIKKANNLPADWTKRNKDGGVTTKNDELARLGRKREQKVNEARAIVAQLNDLDPNNETGIGEGGYPYRKPREGAQAPAQSQGGGRYAGRRISRANVAEFGRRHSMTPEQAEEFLKKEGAIVY